MLCEGTQNSPLSLWERARVRERLLLCFISRPLIRPSATFSLREKESVGDLC